MTFGKAIFAETFDLVEATFGEIAIVAALDHAVDEFVAKQMNVAGVAERCHGAAQSIGFVGRELRRRNRDLHRLFLK